MTEIRRPVQRILIPVLAAGAQTWERAWGLEPDSCRNPGLRRSVKAFTRVADTGLGTRALMRRVGQPWQRLGREFTYCAKRPGTQRVLMTVELSRDGKVTRVRRG